MPKKAPRSSAKRITIPKKLSAEARNALLATLEERFQANMPRHKGVAWSAVQKRLRARPKKMLALFAMEETGGEPDVVAGDSKTDRVTFVDCSIQTPTGRRSVCYDRAAQRARKKFPPKYNALELAQSMGVELLDEERYRALQELGEFDTTTSSWIQTPAGIRERGGALFADRRYDTVFVYHNGADSYYGARGFRCFLKV